MILERLKRYEDLQNQGEDRYSRPEIEALEGARLFPLPDRDTMLVIREEGDSIYIEYALFDYSTGDCSDGTPALMKCIFHGYGFGGGLREMRHTYFGQEAGYVFYLPTQALIDSLKILQEYFDE